MYIWTYVFAMMGLQMGKKRLIVDLLDVDHAELVQRARDAGLTVSNYVRRACGLPLEHQGKRRVEAPKVAPRKAKGKK
jgi:hypothetical protein